MNWILYYCDRYEAIVAMFFMSGLLLTAFGFVVGFSVYENANKNRMKKILIAVAVAVCGKLLLIIAGLLPSPKFVCWI